MIDSKILFSDRLYVEYEIKDALQSYCRGIDRRDFDLVRSVYHMDAEDFHGPYNGNIDGLIEWMMRRHEGVAQSMHMLGNCLIQWDGDTTALVETYCVTYQKLKLGSESSTSDVGLAVGGSGQQTQVRCRYLDRFENRDGSWKIAKRVVAYESLLLEDSSEESPFARGMVLATRGKDDALYALLG